MTSTDLLLVAVFFVIEYIDIPEQTYALQRLSWLGGEGETAACSTEARSGVSDLPSILGWRISHVWNRKEKLSSILFLQLTCCCVALSQSIKGECLMNIAIDIRFLHLTTLGRFECGGNSNTATCKQPRTNKTTLPDSKAGLPNLNWKPLTSQLSQQKRFKRNHQLNARAHENPQISKTRFPCKVPAGVNEVIKCSYPFRVEHVFPVQA